MKTNEIIARAIQIVGGAEEHEIERVWKFALPEAAKVITALSDAGLVIVPREVSDEAMEAGLSKWGWNADDPDAEVAQIWKAMIAETE